MQRSELHNFLLLLIASWQLVSCSSSSTDASQKEYSVQFSFDTDSTVITDNLCLFVDNHIDISVDTIHLTTENVASYTGTTDGTNEMFLLSGDGIELCHFYASAGDNIEVSIKGKADSLEINYTSPSDTINSWLKFHEFVNDTTLTKKEQIQKTQETLDSLKENSLRATLLLRSYMPYLGDSIYVRRYLGGISNDYKPEWLIRSINLLYPQLRPDTNLGRLTAAQFQAQDTLIAINTSSRSDYMLLYFWGDYSQASIDSLKALSTRMEKKWDNSRLIFISFCLSAPDSTWWKEQIKDLPEGHHTLLNAGFADPRIADWQINQIPYNLITDMFTNIQNRNIWDEDLSKAIIRIPKRSYSKSISKKAMSRKK